VHEQSDEAPVIIAQSGALQGHRWRLDEDELLIGRGPDCAVVVPDRQVSRYHARVRREDSHYYIEDLGSKNGTHVNGTKVSRRTELQDGDIIQIALVLELVFIGTEATIPLSRPEATWLGIGRLRMDPDAHRVLIGESEIDPPLSPPQYRLLEMLYRNSGSVISRDDIAEHVWPGTMGVGVSNQAIDALVRRLRDRLASVDPSHSYIVTVRGHGFRFENSL
jgi:DNA-binding response OmpR family regulator